MRIAHALVLVVALSCILSDASADSRIAIAAGDADSGIAHRVRAELAAAGFGVVDLAAWPADARALLDNRVQAVVRVTDDAAEVWIVDPATRRAELRELIRADVAGAPDELSIAVRTAEIVRAALSALPPAPPAPASLLVERDHAPPIAAEPPAAWSIEVGGGVSASPGGTVATAAITFGATWFPTEHIGVGALLLVSPVPASVDASEGSADVWTGLLGAGVAWLPRDPAAPWTLRLEAGFATCLLHMRGAAEAPYVGISDTIATPAPYIRPALRFPINEGLSFELGTIVAVALRRPAIAFAGREVASWGRPAITAFAGLELLP